MKEKFYVGQKVICLRGHSDGYPHEAQFTKGKIYEVWRSDPTYWSLGVIDNFGNQNGWSSNYFTDASKFLHDQAFEKKLEELIK